MEWNILRYIWVACNFFFLDLMLTILSCFVVWTYHGMVTRYSWSRTYWAISEWACNFFFLDLMLTILSNFVVRANYCIPYTLSISPSSFFFCFDRFWFACLFLFGTCKFTWHFESVSFSVFLKTMIATPQLSRMAQTEHNSTRGVASLESCTS